MKQWICVAFALLLACGGSSGGGRSSSSSGSPLIPGCATYNLICPNPGVGQWATAFGQNNELVGTSFLMQGGSGIHYVYTAPQGLALGKTMTLNYTISGNGALTAQPNDTDPPTISLFIWEKGDDLSCGGSTPSAAGPMRYYRQFLTVRPDIEIGTVQTVSALITVPNWTGCYGQDPTGAGFNQAVQNAAYMGFTLGGQSFAGHGVVLKSGSLQFQINSFTVQ